MIFDVNDIRVTIAANAEDVYPNNLQQLICSQCNNTEPKLLGRCHDYSWACLLECPGCNNRWLSCYECKARLRQITTVKGLNEHCRYHIRRKAPVDSLPVDIPPVDSPPVSSFEDIMDDSYDTEGFQVTYISGTPFEHEFGSMFTSVTDPSNLGFSHSANINFFYCYSEPNSDVSGLMSALGFLVKQSQTRLNFALPTQHHDITTPLNHILLQLQLARFSVEISINSRRELASICGGVHEIGYEDGWVSCSRAIGRENSSAMTKLSYDSEAGKGSAHLWGTRIPSRPNDMRRLYGDNKKSIKENLPYPREVANVGRDHACVQIEQCLRHMLAHQCSRIGNIDPNFELSETITHPAASPRAKEIIERAKCIHGDNIGMLVCYLILWGDDCDVGHFGDQNVYVKTCTVGGPTADGNRLLNTFPIAVGVKGVSHEVVEINISEDLAALQCREAKPFFIGKGNKAARIHWDVLCQLGDQPERRNLNGLSLGSGKYACRWLVSANHNDLYGFKSSTTFPGTDNRKAKGVLPSCQTCLEFMRTTFDAGKFNDPIPCCEKCLNWDASLDSPLSLTDAHVKYPKADPMGRLVLCDSNGMENRPPQLRTFQITYEGLRQAIVAAFDGIRKDGWGKGEAEQFLKVECLNDAMIKQCCNNATNAKGLDDAVGQAKVELQQDKEDNPDDFAPPLLAQYLRNELPLSSHIDVIMHLVFLGLEKSTVMVVQESLKRRDANTAFIRNNAGYLKCFCSQYTVDWLTIMPFTGGKLGGWKSAEYLGFARIMLWFYQNLEEAVAEPVQIELPPEEDQAKWSKEQNKYWLKIRGIPGISKLRTVIGFRSKVADEMKKDPRAEVLEIPVIDYSEVLNLLVYLSEAIKCIMCEKVTPEVCIKTDFAVRLYISAYDNLDRKLRKKGEKPGVITSYNFSSLLNLSATMKRFGPLRHLWEGKWQGEAFLQRLKPIMTQGLRENWQRNLLRHLLRDIAFENIFQSIEMEMGNNNSRTKGFLHLNSAKLHKYKSRHEVGLLLGEVRCVKKAPAIVVLVHCDVLAISKIFVVVHDYESVCEITHKTNGIDDEVSDDSGLGEEEVAEEEVSEDGAEDSEDDDDDDDDDDSTAADDEEDEEEDSDAVSSAERSDNESEAEETDGPEFKAGLHYFKFELGGDVLDWQDEMDQLQSPRIGFGALLPLLDTTNNRFSAGRFALISSNWQVLDDKNSIDSLIVD